MTNNKRRWAIILGIVLIITLLLTAVYIYTYKKKTPVGNPPEKTVQESQQPDLTNPENKDEETKDIQVGEDGQWILANPDDLLALVNKKRNLPSDYVPPSLEVSNPSIVSYTISGQLERNMVRDEVVDPLIQLIAKSKEAGLDLWIASGYRSYTTQKNLFDKNVEKKGELETNKLVALPGQSEHQTGLAVDFTTSSMGYTLEETFENTEEGKWLRENAYKFGFILRYPKGKEAITGYSYEPWHFRYVGEEVAKKIYDLDITLEEYLDK